MGRGGGGEIRKKRTNEIFAFVCLFVVDVCVVLCVLWLLFIYLLIVSKVIAPV